MANNRPASVYRVVFYNQGTVYEIYAKQVLHDSTRLIGFIEVSDLIFNANSSIVVDPSEEKLKNEFCGVKKVFIPMHNVARIDEVEKEGIAKIREISGKSNVAQFPMSFYTSDPKKPPSKS